MILPEYRNQVNLLLQVLPFVAKEQNFALKGGTAINLFVREMPRLSVDIDLTYLPVDVRHEALSNIQNGLTRIKADIEKNIENITVHPVSLYDGSDVKLHCQRNNAQVKIEVNTITRGHVYDTKVMQVVDRAQDEFDKFAAINVVSFAELYGGKICAAVDRQHPRDLFDVKLLLENEGLTNEIWLAFMIGLISHYRPVNELLFPRLKEQRSAFEKQFAGMTFIDFSYDDYEKVRADLLKKIHGRLDKNSVDFLLSFESGEPDWALCPVEKIKELPAVKWKLLNIKKLIDTNPDKQKLQLRNFREQLGV
ncbi:MAG: nucleotidyl transferase AbiEii/AbiGii toxin family protein [Bacteroidetes bacterium]|nr:nucleotidyl transferase AbiEii/AbiGii toxin family protein [Bacteroidota bacterium]MBU1720366.1 nucleotidyl transferase AbiEii/AbiGii toxin family protein [Bacteroidota bacterium]